MHLSALARIFMARHRLTLLALSGAMIAAAAALPGAERGSAKAVSRTFGALVPTALAAPPASASPPSASTPPPPASTAPAEVLLLATPPGSAESTLHRAWIGGGKAGPALATLRHLPDAVVRARLLPGAPIVVATADTQPTRDASFNATLFRIAPGAEPRPLCDRVVHASRPLVTEGGRVFVSRGVAGPEPPLDGGFLRLREDTLTIDEVDPDSGATRTVHAHTGYLAFLAGELQGELVLYRVSPGSADLVAVDPDSGRERTIVASIPPFARDFSIDAAAGALVFQGRHEADPATWVIERVELATGKRSRLAASAYNGLAPHVWPGGGVAYTPDRAKGLLLLGARASVRGPLGPGVDAIQAISQDGVWVAALHMKPSAFAVPFAIHAPSGAALAIPAPAGARIAIAGIVAAQRGRR